MFFNLGFAAACEGFRFVRFAVLRLCSMVQRETLEGEGASGHATGEDAAETVEQQHGDEAAAAANPDGGSLGRSGTEAQQPMDASSRSQQLPPNLLPDNPLEDDQTVERWLQRVRLLQQNDKEMEVEAAAAAAENMQGEEGHGAEGGGDSREETGEPSALQRGQTCQRDDASGYQEAMAEASEAAAMRPNTKAKLAEAADNR